MKKKVMLNVGCTMLCQLVTFISGLIVPRLILSTFGSEANGLVSSITQFLNYIALVEGGIGSVVLTALYGPLAKKDDRKISSVLKAAENFFRQIASIFVFYMERIPIGYRNSLITKRCLLVILSGINLSFERLSRNNR